MNGINNREYRLTLPEFKQLLSNKQHSSAAIEICAHDIKKGVHLTMNALFSKYCPRTFKQIFQICMLKKAIRGESWG